MYDAGAHYMSGFIWTKLGDYEAALSCYDQALELDPGDTLVLNGKGNALTDMGRYQAAVECYDEALRVDPEFETARGNKVAAKALQRLHEMGGLDGDGDDMTNHSM